MENPENAESVAKSEAERLLGGFKHAAGVNPDLVPKALAFCEPYKAYLDAGKTERACAKETRRLLEQAGYSAYVYGKKYKKGEKVAVYHRGKAVIAATIGKKSLQEGVRMVIAHIDSPRLDLKPNPLYETDQIAYFKTHYYGGIRKYQWVATPLAMHGVAVRADGTLAEMCLGEQPGEPCFTITDLLPHLAAEQSKRPLSDGIRGEELNILAGSLPFGGEGAADGVRLETMRLMNALYGITERDFVRAEIEFVPAYKAADVGFDKSMVGAYGQDDRVCAYTALRAEIEQKKPEHTTLCVLTDKEETGSDGNTGLGGEYLFHFLQNLAEANGVNYPAMLAASACLSADVNAAYDPSFPDVFEKRNSSQMNQGVVITKYTGSRGKSGTSDANAEFVGSVTNMLDKQGVPWQIGELGKVDAGGGGTIAKFVANKNVDVLDVGVPVLSMHSPFEVTAKTDVYATYLAFLAFYKQP